MQVEAVRDDGALMVTDGEAAAVILPGGQVSYIAKDSVYARGGWEPASGPDARLHAVDAAVLRATRDRLEGTGPKPAARRSVADDLDDEADMLWRAGNENGFKKYWLTGTGLKKWALSARPWTTLFKHLVKHMPAEKARRVASQWFLEHFGYASGSDKNRVAHGHPPRGDRVGPG